MRPSFLAVLAAAWSTIGAFARPTEDTTVSRLDSSFSQVTKDGTQSHRQSPSPELAQVGPRQLREADRPSEPDTDVLQKLMSIPAISKYPATLSLLSDVLLFAEQQRAPDGDGSKAEDQAHKLNSYSELLLPAKLGIAESSLVMAETFSQEMEKKATRKSQEKVSDPEDDDDDDDEKMKKELAAGLGTGLGLGAEIGAPAVWHFRQNIKSLFRLKSQAAKMSLKPPNTPMAQHLKDYYPRTTTQWLKESIPTKFTPQKPASPPTVRPPVKGRYPPVMPGTPPPKGPPPMPPKPENLKVMKPSTAPPGQAKIPPKVPPKPAHLSTDPSPGTRPVQPSGQSPVKAPPTTPEAPATHPIKNPVPLDPILQAHSPPKTPSQRPVSPPRTPELPPQSPKNIVSIPRIPSPEPLTPPGSPAPQVNLPLPYFEIEPGLPGIQPGSPPPGPLPPISLPPAAAIPVLPGSPDGSGRKSLDPPKSPGAKSPEIGSPDSSYSKSPVGSPDGSPRSTSPAPNPPADLKPIASNPWSEWRLNNLDVDEDKFRPPTPPKLPKLKDIGPKSPEDVVNWIKKGPPKTGGRAPKRGPGKWQGSRDPRRAPRINKKKPVKPIAEEDAEMPDPKDNHDDMTPKLRDWKTKFEEKWDEAREEFVKMADSRAESRKNIRPKPKFKGANHFPPKEAKNLWLQDLPQFRSETKGLPQFNYGSKKE